MKAPAYLLLTAIALAACSSTSGVQRLGPDTYLLSTQVMFGPNKAGSSRTAALAQAGEYCAQQGKEILVDDFKTAGHAMSVTGDTQLTFKCLNKGDPDLRRPTYTQPATIVIEDRRK